MLSLPRNVHTVKIVLELPVAHWQGPVYELRRTDQILHERPTIQLEIYPEDRFGECKTETFFPRLQKASRVQTYDRRDFLGESWPKRDRRDDILRIIMG